MQEDLLKVKPKTTMLSLLDLSGKKHTAVGGTQYTHLLGLEEGLFEK